MGKKIFNEYEYEYENTSTHTLLYPLTALIIMTHFNHNGCGKYKHEF
jgi:hypothetical protein